jgi:hypothetical protein
MNLGRGAACLAAVCVFVPSAAQAALWAVDPSMELSSAANDNYGLAFDRRNRVGSLSVTGGLVASRETESAATRLDASLVGLALRGDLHQDEWQDSLALSHALSGPVDSFTWDAKSVRDQTLQTPVSSADLLIGRGLQRNTSADAAWRRNITERLSMDTGLDIRRARYSASLRGARDYQDGSGSASLRYLLDERGSVNARFVHQDYRSLDNDVRVLTDSLSLGETRALSENISVALSGGGYRSRSAVVQAVLVCPGDAASCANGQAPVVVAQVGHSARWGVQYNASCNGQIDERTRFAASAGRQQDPSGAGVTVLSDTLHADLDRTYSETLSGALAYTRSSSRFQGTFGGGPSRLQTLSASVNKALSPRWSLRAHADYQRSVQAFEGLRAHALSLSVTLRYEWQRVEAHP